MKKLTTPVGMMTSEAETLAHAILQVILLAPYSSEDKAVALEIVCKAVSIFYPSIGEYGEAAKATVDAGALEFKAKYN